MADAAELTGTFHRPFAEQVAAWRLRLGRMMPTQRWDDVWKESHDTGFMVAGALKADLLADLAEAVGKAIETGTSIEEFRRDFRATVAKHGWHGWTGEGTKAGEAWRTRVIYSTNMRSTYAAGRYAQLVAGGFPLWVYRHSGAEHPRLEHLAWDGLILPADHPFWATHFPPNDWGCGCSVVGARSIRDAVRKGGNPMVELSPDWDLRDMKTGEPQGIGRGWGYAPGRTVADQVRAAIAAKLPTLPPEISEELVAEVETPPPPKAPPLRLAKNLKDAARLVVESGLAEKEVSWPAKVPLDSVNDVMQAIWELKHRFPMVPLQALGSSTVIGRRAGTKVPRSASAWYGHGMRAIGWNPVGLDRKPWMSAEAQARRTAHWKAEHKVALARMPEGPAKRAAELAEWRHAIVEGGPDYPRGVAIHEVGHQLHFSNWEEITAATTGWKTEGWNYAVSSYGSKNFKEFVAESFVLYILGPEHHPRIKPELLAVFKKLDRWNV